MATRLSAWLRGFAVRGVFWRNYLDWAVVNTPFYTHFVLICFWTLFFFFFAAPARRAVIANLRVVLPHSFWFGNQLRALRVFYNFAWTITDAAVHKLTKAPFRCEIVGAQILDQLGAAQGAIVLTAHMGSYDLGAALFAEKFNRQIRIVRAPEPQRETEQHLRSSLITAGAGGLKIDYSSSGALLSFDLLNALRAGEIVSIQGDRVISDVAQVEGTLFGRTIHVPIGPFALAQVAGVAIFPLFIIRVGYRHYAIILHEPIRLEQGSSNRDAAIAEAVTKWCRALESVVAEHWRQWFAFTPLFSFANA